MSMFKDWNKEAKTVSTDDPLSDLIYGGYIVPEDLLMYHEDIDRVRNAVDIIVNFIEDAMNNGILEER